MKMHRCLLLSSLIIIPLLSAEQREQDALAEEYCYLADHFEKIGKQDKALELYEKALSCQSNNTHAQAKLGSIYYEKNNIKRAIVCYTNSLDEQDNNAHIHYNLALCYMKLSSWKEAKEQLQQTVSLDPHHAQAYLHLGSASEKLQQFDDAVAAYKKMIALNDQSYEAYHHLGNALRHLERLEEAVEPYRKAIELQPKNIHLMMDLANALNMINRNEESLEYYQKIIEINPNAISALYNFGFTLKKMDRMERALEVYEQVLAKKPDHAPAHFSLSSIYLTLGNFEKGWEEYEWRWKVYNEDPKKFNRPLWKGESLDNKTLLVYAEQGLGDTIHFIRYLKVLKERYPSAHLIFETQAPLAQLLKNQPYIDRLFSRKEEIPGCHYHISLMSVPYILKTNLETIPANTPYITPHQHRVDYWKEKLAADSNFKIGICWQGNARYSTQALRRAVAAKSLSLEQFKPLAAIAGVSLYSLQRVDGTDQIENCSFKNSLIVFDEQFDKAHGGFCDTAAVMKHLDLIISVDTGVCHLSGAMDIPTWIPLPLPADWRWLRGRTDSPWYPSVRLFKQKTSGDWQPVMDAIVQAIKERVSPGEQSPSISYKEFQPTKEQELFFEQLINGLE